MSERYGTPVKERRRRGDGRREGGEISGQVSRKFRDNICNGNQRGSALIVAYYSRERDGRTATPGPNAGIFNLVRATPTAQAERRAETRGHGVSTSRGNAHRGSHARRGRRRALGAAEAGAGRRGRPREMSHRRHHVSCVASGCVTRARRSARGGDKRHATSRNPQLPPPVSSILIALQQSDPPRLWANTLTRAFLLVSALPRLPAL